MSVFLLPRLSPAHLVCLAMNYLQDWFDKNRDINSFESSSCDIQPLERWIKPFPCVLKCNIDAAIFQDQCKTCIRTVLRDSMGDFVACATFSIVGIYQVREAKAIAMWEAPSWIKGKDFHDVL